MSEWNIAFLLVLPAVLTVGVLIGHFGFGRKCKEEQYLVKMTSAIARAQASFISEGDTSEAFSFLLDDLIKLTDSEFGFIGEVLRSEKNQPYLKTHAISDISWDKETKALYDEKSKDGFDFTCLGSLYGRVLTSGAPVFANDPSADPRRAGTPKGHPPLSSFMGVPIYVNHQLIAMVGVANKQQGYHGDDADVLAPLLATIGQMIDGRRTVRKKLETERQLQDYKNLIDSSNDAVVMARNGFFVDCNSAAEKMFGLPREKLLGLTPVDVSPPLQRDGRSSKEQAEKMLELTMQGKPQTFDWLHQHVNGEVILANIALHKINAGDDDVLVGGVIRDVTEETRYQDAIAKQKYELEMVVANTAVGMWDWEVDTGRLRINERWAEIIGYTLAELEPITVDTWLGKAHPEDLKKSEELLKNHWEGRDPYYIFEARMRHKNGSWIWVLDSGRVVERANDGSPKRMIGTHLDITEKKNSELKIKKLEGDLGKFFEVSLDFMCIANINGMFERVNTAFVERLGYDRQTLMETPFLEFIHPDDIDKTVRETHRLALGKTSRNFKTRYRKADGEYITLNWMCSPDPETGKLFAAAHDITDQELIEKELSKLSRIARETRNGVVITDAKGCVEWVNEGFTRITGYSLVDVKGHKPGHVLQGEKSDSKIKALISESVRDGKPFKTEILNYRKTGEAYWIDIDCSPLLSNDGVLQGFMAIETDITQQKESEIEINKQASLLEQMSRHGRIGAWEVNLETEEIYWSPMTKIIHEVAQDYSPELESAINFYKEGESRESISVAVAKAIEEGVPWYLECQLVTGKGREIWVAATGQAEFVNGKCHRLFGSFQDINERKSHQLSHQQALRHSQTLANLTVHPDVIAGDLAAACPVIAKACANALSVNRVSIWFFNEADDAMVCESIYMLDLDRHDAGVELKKSDLPIYFNHISTESIISANDVYAHPATVEFKGGYLEKNRIFSMLDAVIAGGGGITGVVCFEHVDTSRNWTSAEETFSSAVATLVGSVFDRKLRRRTEQQLIGAIEKANSAVQAKSDFLASMSHEIRTPMNGVLGMLGLVLKTPLRADQERKVKIAQNSAQSLLSIINDILDFSKIDAQKLQLEELEFSLSALVSEFSESVRFRAEEQSIEYSVDHSAVHDNHLIGDPGRLRQILNNLVGNALKFTHSGSIQLILSTELLDSHEVALSCSVIDTGIGIPRDKIELLFDAFTQVDASNTREYGGTGLGLSIVKRLCEAMGGSVRVESKPGEGSVFSFLVKVKKNLSPTLQLPELNQRIKILLVDDNAVNQKVVSEQLSAVGIQVSIAGDAAQALALCEQAYADGDFFDIGIVDFQMPGVNGEALGKALKNDERFQDLKLIMLSSQAERGEAQRYADLGFAAYFPKPIDSQTLLDAVAVVQEGSLLSVAYPLVTRHFLGSLVRPEGDLIAESGNQWSEEARILLVEDNKINQEVALDILHDFGLQADVAGDGREAVHMLSQGLSSHPYSLVLMDCQMPVMDGFDATRAIRSGLAGDENSSIAIVAMTANAMKGDRERCLEVGMNDYVSKPIDPDVLNAVLVKQLNTPPTVECLNDDSLNDPLDNASELTPNVAASSLHDVNALVWDYQAALKRVRGRHDRLQRLINMYKENSAILVSDLFHKVEAHEYQEAASLCHALKGVAGNLGGIQLMEVVAGLEQHCLASNSDEAEKTAGELLLKNEVLISVLNDYLEKPKASEHG